MKPVRIATTALLLALCAAGCGGSSTVTSVRIVPGTQSSSATSAATATSSGGPTVTSIATSSSSSAVAASGPACTAADLALSFESTNGAVGTLVATFELRNTSAGPCHTYGWPGVLFLDKDGGSLPTQATRTTHDVLGATPATAIVLQPGQIASFRIAAQSNPTGTGCTTAGGLQAIPPDDTATLRTAIPGGFYECIAATLTPLIAGNGLPPGT
ncbi:MAG: DUF4232 domain-containing protein [Solirubrobacteraceae bacterium]